MSAIICTQSHQSIDLHELIALTSDKTTTAFCTQAALESIQAISYLLCFLKTFRENLPTNLKSVYEPDVPI